MGGLNAIGRESRILGSALGMGVGYGANRSWQTYLDAVTYKDPHSFGGEFWGGIYTSPPTVGLSFTILGQTTSISTAGVKVNLSPTTLFGASVDFQSWAPKSNIEVGAGLSRHLGVGTFVAEKGVNPWSLHFGVAKGLPVYVSGELTGVDWNGNSSRGLLDYFINRRR